MTVSDRFNEWGAAVAERLEAEGFRAEVDRSSDTLGGKIRNAQLAKVPFALVVGEKEVEGRAVAPRRHGGQDLEIHAPRRVRRAHEEGGDAAVLSLLRA